MRSVDSSDCDGGGRERGLSTYSRSRRLDDAAGVLSSEGGGRDRDDGWDEDEAEGCADARYGDFT